MNDLYTVQTIEVSIPVAEYLRFGVDVKKFAGYCQKCRNYGGRWSCPPFDFDPIDIGEKYQTLHIHARILVPEMNTDTQTLLEDMKWEKTILLEELLSLEKNVPGSMALSAGNCDICGDDCTRQNGVPCRCPEKMRYSIEALGGDVAKTAERYLHKPLLWIKDSKMSDYLTLVGGLLTMEADR